jgi:purine-nucleoside phosphorylase
MPLHIHATPEEVAPIAILPGDPSRAERCASLLEDARCYNTNRGLLGFTGLYQGRRISVQTTGMGAPSAAIVAEELAMLGTRVLIRAGTAGGGRGTRTGDIVIATASVPLDGCTAAYVSGEPYAPAADFAVVSALVERCRALGVPHHIGLICTGDALYAEDRHHAERWLARGVLAFEMEASALFTVAALRGLRAGCIVLVTNAAGQHERLDGDAYAAGERALLTVALATAAEIATTLSRNAD